MVHIWEVYIFTVFHVSQTVHSNFCVNLILEVSTFISLKRTKWINYCDRKIKRVTENQISSYNVKTY